MVQLYGVMNPRVKHVVARHDYKLEITFTNEEVGVFDCAHLLSFGVFKELQDIRYFKQARAERGTVVWPRQQDICPDTLYEDSQAIECRRQGLSTSDGIPAFVAFISVRVAS